MLRDLKILLIALVALWGLFGLVGNLMHLGGTYETVRAVASMEGIETGAPPPQATDSVIIVWLGVLLILVGKAAAAGFCGFGAAAMVQARGKATVDFQHAKRFAILGCGLAVAMLFGGFTVIGEVIFQMWRTPFGEGAANGALRYGGFIALIMIYVAQPE